MHCIVQKEFIILTIRLFIYGAEEASQPHHNYTGAAPEPHKNGAYMYLVIAELNSKATIMVQQSIAIETLLMLAFYSNISLTPYGVSLH